ncbi:MAG TPA: hypothetical protein VGA58_13715 [bacterium]
MIGDREIRRIKLRAYNAAHKDQLATSQRPYKIRGEESSPNGQKDQEKLTESDETGF